MWMIYCEFEAIEVIKLTKLNLAFRGRKSE